jgi:hypothetical protein
MKNDTLSIRDRFLEFHADNPHVAVLLEELAQQMVDAGRRRIGIKMLFEVARWHFYITTDSKDEFKLNNSYTAHYARLLLEMHPEWGDLFQLRDAVLV